MTDKTSVEDIIGIVKTEEPTNSVQLKKEAQLSICEKRVRELEKENEQLKHDATVLIQANQDYRRENEQLKSKNKGLQSELQIFKEDVTHSNLQINKLAEENEQLKKENQELRQDNDIKFWKLQCIQSSNNNQIMLFELSRAIQQGYEVSDKFKQYLNEIKEHDKEIREKHKRLFE